PNNETAAAGDFPSERPRSTRDRVLSYREALKQQEQQERRRQEREEREHFEAQLEADMKNHEPWGRGGGGAPLRDSQGNLIGGFWILVFVFGRNMSVFSQTSLMSCFCVSQQKAKNEELIQLAEQRRKEAERKKKEADEKESAALRRQYEKERQMRVEEVSSKIQSLQRAFSSYPNPAEETRATPAAHPKAPQCPQPELHSSPVYHLGEASPVPPTPEHERVRQLSARERRRLAKQTQRPQVERAASNQPVVPQRNHPDPSGTRQNLEEAGCEFRSLNRTGQLMALSRREPMDVSDGDSSPPEFSPLSLNRESSEETVTTDSWFGAGTSDTLKRLDRPSRRKQLST
ncbi:hypothetical protein GOODEAATRI_013815, partial [Goodea atripinnis]